LESELEPEQVLGPELEWEWRVLAEKPLVGAAAG
jgi:hypothetical protein